MEEKPEEVEDAESTSGESFIDGSEDEGPSTSGQDDEELHLEVSEFVEDNLLHTFLARVCLS
jgi:hypothetical protein